MTRPMNPDDMTKQELIALIPRLRRFARALTGTMADADDVVQASLEKAMTNLDQWEEGTNVLTLMTFHTAKGLEFPHVYMIGLEEGIFPNVNSFSEDRDEIEEERRLCYVGITRAKEKLTITYARQRRLYGSRQFNLPSRFLNEIPPETCQFRTESHRPLSEVADDDFDDILIEYDDSP